MSKDIQVTDIPNSGGLQIRERIVSKKAAQKIKIEREIIDIEALIRKTIEEDGCYSLEGCEENQHDQEKFNKSMRIIFKVLRTFPESKIATSELKKRILDVYPPWRILSHMENVPLELHDIILSRFKNYIQTNPDEIYKRLEICQAIGESLSHIACYPNLQIFLSQLITEIPSDIAYQILRSTQFDDTLESLLISRSEGFGNAMTQKQREEFEERKAFSKHSCISGEMIPESIEILHGGVIFQIFPNDRDGYLSFQHFLKMLQKHNFSHDDFGGIHIFTNENLKFIVNDPRSGCDENIIYFLEQNQENIDVCIIRGHTGLIDILKVLESCNARTVMIGGCESSKNLRKDIQTQASREGLQGIIKGRTYITSNGIGNMSVNDGIIDLIINAANPGEKLKTEDIDGVSGGRYDTFQISY